MPVVWARSWAWPVLEVRVALKASATAICVGLPFSPLRKLDTCENVIKMKIKLKQNSTSYNALQQLLSVIVSVFPLLTSNGGRRCYSLIAVCIQGHYSIVLRLLSVRSYDQPERKEPKNITVVVFLTVSLMLLLLLLYPLNSASI